MGPWGSLQRGKVDIFSCATSVSDEVGIEIWYKLKAGLEVR